MNASTPKSNEPRTEAGLTDAEAGRVRALHSQELPQQRLEPAEQPITPPNVLTSGSIEEDAAHAYVDLLRWHVVACVPRHKKPLPPHSWRSATLDHDVIRRWFRAEPHANIGVAAVTSGLLGIDADGRHGGPGAVSDLERDLCQLPATAPRMTTGDGYRLVLAHPPLDDKSRLPGKLRTGSGEVHVLSSSQFLVPPSTHENGKRYVWENAPDDARIVALPEVWLAHLLSSLPPPRTTTCSSAKCSGALCSGADAFSELERIFRERASVERLLPLIRMDAPIGTAVLCPLPGHQESRPSASIDPKSFVFNDFHSRDERSWYLLQEVYASLRSGQVVHFKKGSQARAVWAARLAFDAGLLDVNLGALPDDLSPSQHAAAEGFRLRYLLNEHRHPEKPAIMYSIDFAAAWCGLPHSTAADALRVLRNRDVLRRVEQIETCRGRVANLYVPGDGSKRPREGRWTH